MSLIKKKDVHIYLTITNKMWVYLDLTTVKTNMEKITWEI
jgi:hypothetical protein